MVGESSGQRKTFLDHCLKNKQGQLAVWQRPNLPLIVWLVARGLHWLAAGAADRVVRTLGFGALFTWAWLELFQGVNYFRRGLGLVVLGFLLLSGLHSQQF